MNEKQSTNTESNDSNVESLTKSVEETNTPSAVTGGTKNVVVRNYAIATFIILLMGGGLWLVLESQGRVSTNYLGYFANRGPAAIVNGVEISKAEYNANRVQIEASAVSQGADISDPTVIAEINTQAIESLINTELLKQEAQKRNLAISSEESDARRNQIVEQLGGEETLATRMSELGITEEDLRSDIEDELIFQKLFAEVANVEDIEVTDEEVAEVFAQASAQGGGDITLDDSTREIIKTNIRMSKEQALITEYIESLRSGAAVEVKM